MKTLRRLAPAVLGVALLATTLTGCEWPEGTRYVHEVFTDPPVRTAGITYRSTTTYTGQPIDLKLDIYEPAGDTAAKRPVVVWGFGGFWQNGNRDQLRGYAEDSARRGYVGVTIDYRLRSSEGFDLVGASNDAADDTVAAVRWLRDNAARYRLDPSAIVVGGYSAGAINALHAIYRPNPSPAAAAVAIAGLTFTPPTSGRPPSSQFHGTADSVAPFSAGQASCDQSRAVGNVCVFVPYEGDNHFIAFTRIDDIQARTADFIFEQVLLPRGYKAEQVPAAAAA